MTPLPHRPPQPPRHAERTALAAALAALFAALLLPGCGTDRTAEPPASGAAEAEAPAAPVAAGRFDLDRSVALLTEARAAEAGRNLAEAQRLYREAGLAWPDNEAAWQGLASLARQRGEREEAAAAGFMLDRIRTYPSGQLYVQREVNIALKEYVAEQRALPAANPAQIAYASNLAEYYDALYAARGTFQEPGGLFGTGYGNIERREIPATILSLGGAAAYFGVLAVGSGEQTTD